MKKILLSAVLLCGAATMANAQVALRQPSFCDNWSVGLNGGVTTPLNKGAFFGNMRGVVGLNIQKQLTPVFGLGVEGDFAVNTSSWRGAIHSNTAFDQSYVGAYGAVNLFNLFTPYSKDQGRVFDIEAVAGAGWGHLYKTGGIPDNNYFATKLGLNLNFHPCSRVTLALKPSITYNMTDLYVEQTTCAYNVNRAQFNLTAGVSVALGKQFEYVEPYRQDEINALNASVNELRDRLGNANAELANANAAIAEANARNQALASELDACRNKAPQVVKQTTDILSTIRYVNFELGRYNITASQMPNVAAVASYLKNHPESKVVIKGYASQDGPLDVNIRLANQRAESVKTTLINKYGIKADRIQAEGQGIGHMFEEESWNRVAVCILDNAPVTTTVVK